MKEVELPLHTNKGFAFNSINAVDFLENTNSGQLYSRSTIEWIPFLPQKLKAVVKAISPVSVL